MCSMILDLVQLEQSYVKMYVRRTYVQWEMYVRESINILSPES